MLGCSQDCVSGGGCKEEDKKNDGICIVNIDKYVLSGLVGDPWSTRG